MNFIEVVWGHQYLFADNLPLKRVRDMVVVSLCLSGHDASTDCNMTYLGQHLTSRDLDLRSNIDLTFQGQCFAAPWREEHVGARIIPLASVVLKLYAKHVSAKNSYVDVFLPLAPKPLTYAQIWWNLSDRSSDRPVQELSSVVFCGLLAMIIFEIIARFTFRISLWHNILHIFFLHVTVFIGCPWDDP